MNLLYRGSRDGFEADDFHRLCDKKDKTLTVIQTTKGYIFGGFTNQSWSSGDVWRHDNIAFLFSLVNKFNKPFLCNIVNYSKAQLSNPKAGPCFGGSKPYSSENCDIYISDKCNQNEKSSSKLNAYEISDDDLHDPNGFYLCDTNHFQVKEIEVFRFKK